MVKIYVWLGLLAAAIILYAIAKLAPCLRIVGMVSAVLFLGLVIWLLLAILLSGRKQEAPSRFSERIVELGHLTLDAGSVIHTDDDHFERNMGVIEGLHPGDYDVTLRVREYAGGEKEGVALYLRCGDLAGGGTREVHEVVTDTGVLAIACASVKDWPNLADACRDDFKRLLKKPDSAIFVNGPDGRPRILLFAPPDGEGCYSMVIKTAHGGSEVALNFLQEDSQ